MYIVTKFRSLSTQIATPIYIPLINGVDGELLPSTLLATTLTTIVVEGGHEEEFSMSKL